MTYTVSSGTLNLRPTQLNSTQLRSSDFELTSGTILNYYVGVAISSIVFGGFRYILLEESIVGGFRFSRGGLRFRR